MAQRVKEKSTNPKLWSHESFGPMEIRHNVALLLANLGNPKVRNLQVVVVCDHHVLGFDVPVDNLAEGVEVVQAFDQVSEVSEAFVFRESSFLLLFGVEATFSLGESLCPDALDDLADVFLFGFLFPVLGRHHGALFDKIHDHVELLVIHVINDFP